MNGFKQQVLYIHGGSSFSDNEAYLNNLKTRIIRYPNIDKPDRWSKFLRYELGSEFEVFTPEMPNKDNSKYQEWKIWFERHLEFLHDDAILLGWSQGALFFQKYLVENKLPFRLQALILVAPPVYRFTTPTIGEDGGDFNFDNDRIPKLKEITSNIVVYHSEDDFVVPYDHALKLKTALPDAELVTFTDRNHFLQAEFPELINKIKEIAGK